MKTILLAFLAFLLGFSVQAQTPDRWIAFRDSTSELLGFKNSSGQIKIHPKFLELTTANYFDNIIAVMENNNGRYESYYLTKEGKVVGRDSLHIFDNEVDCESEGFIRFKDKATDKVGMFGKSGSIVIPAVYNSLSRVHNGLIWALKGATKKDLDGEHSYWEGGEVILINTKNDIVVKNVKYENYLNLYSLEIKSKPTSDSNRQSYKGDNSKYYSFIDFEKEFKNWLNSNLLKSLTLKKLARASNDSITFWQETNGWVSESKSDFLNRNFELIRARLQVLKEKEADYFFAINELNSFIFNGKSFDKYYNNCGEGIIEKYPVMDLIISTKSEADITQDHFQFLRTDNGYKLISVTIRNGQIK